MYVTPLKKDICVIKPLIRLLITWPAITLAAKRNIRVTGRIKALTNSINTRKIISPVGLLLGVKWVINEELLYKNKFIKIGKTNIKEKKKVKRGCLVIEKI